MTGGKIMITAISLLVLAFTMAQAASISCTCSPGAAPYGGTTFNDNIDNFGTGTCAADGSGIDDSSDTGNFYAGDTCSDYCYGDDNCNSCCQYCCGGDTPTPGSYAAPGTYTVTVTTTQAPTTVATPAPVIACSCSPGVPPYGGTAFNDGIDNFGTGTCAANGSGIYDSSDTGLFYPGDSCSAYCTGDNACTSCCQHCCGGDLPDPGSYAPPGTSNVTVTTTQAPTTVATPPPVIACSCSPGDPAYGGTYFNDGIDNFGTGTCAANGSGIFDGTDTGTFFAGDTCADYCYGDNSCNSCCQHCCGGNLPDPGNYAPPGTSNVTVTTTAAPTQAATTTLATPGPGD